MKDASLSKGSQHSYQETFHSTAIMGSVAALSFVIGVLRNKAAAVLIGTGGLGFMVALMALSQFVGALTGLGIQMSGVREIAVAASSRDELQLGRTVLSLRRMCFLTGFVGMSLMIVMSPLLSQLAFGHQEYSSQIALLGVSLLLGSVSAGQTSIIQGLRKIGDLALVNLLGFGIGTLVAIGFFALWGIDGVVMALVAGSAIQLIVSWCYARKIDVPIVNMTWRESFAQAGGLLRLGLAFMWSSLITSAVALGINAVITQQISIEALGLYTAAFTLSGMFINFVLRAMGTDFYPRLAGVSDDHSEMNRLVNEQVEVGVLLVGPGLIATLALAPVLVIALYSSQFQESVQLIHWFVLGVMQRVVSWPLGFMLRAVGDNQRFVLTETLFHLSHLVFAVAGLLTFGLEGAATGFLAMNLLTTILIFLVVRKQFGFSWTKPTIVISFQLFIFLLAAVIFIRTAPVSWSLSIGVFCAILLGLFNLRKLHSLLGSEHALFERLFRIPGAKTFICGHSPI